MPPSLLMMGKKDDAHCAKAMQQARTLFGETEFRLARRGDEWPSDIDAWRGDYVISYLSPFIIPQALLQRARKAAINFHPGPPEYPGIGCTNFAIYNEETTFGVTCHHMAAAVDTGPIVAVRRFPLAPDDSVLTLTGRCYDAILEMFFEFTSLIAAGEPLPVSAETWQRRPYTRRELDALCRITADMEADEVARRVRAVTYPGQPGAFIEMHGYHFALAPEERETSR
ncbi:MAG: formyltransferase family protein [Rhodospirillales bacterium]|jgi:methionyl-tRNA formyltransferase|nr:formyltransferase family protein [Rhodospirillales bacterium]MDP6883775.1 formyltransferase family protein [Rhodospirillales bacterium]